MEEKKYQVRQLLDNVYTFEEGERVRSFLIIGEEKAAMIDSGNGLVNFELELPKLTDKPIVLINTHGDNDHTARNELFELRYIHEADYAKLRQKRTDENEKYNFVKDGDVFDLGGYKLQVIETPGHTAGSICLYDEEHKIMFGGDTLTSYNTFMFSVSTDKKVMLETLKQMIEKNYDVDVLLTCHDGCPINNYEALLNDTATALEMYLNGEPETEIYYLEKGSHPRHVKRYIYGVATIIPEIVSEY